MSEWVVKSIKDLGIVITGKTPSKNHPEDWGDEYCFITPSDYYTYNKYASSSIRYLSNLGANRQKNKLLPKYSLLVTCIGSDMGKVVINAKSVITNQQINALVPNKDIADYNFLYYLFKNSVILLKILGSDGTAVPILNKTDFENIEYLIPPLPEQKAIADVLSALDDKIDLLQRQNETLEKMAETLFRQWFIEEAKEDWETYKLADLADIYIGRTPPRKESKWFTLENKNLKWISIKDLAAEGVFITNTAESLSLSTIDKFKIPIIPKDTVMLSFKMTVGRVAISIEDMISNEAIAQFQLKDAISKEYLYCFLKNYNFDTLGTTSSIVTSINTALIKNIEVMLPNPQLISDFTKIVQDLFNKVRGNQEQIQTLQNMRDTLLPKLMSGEVRVKLD